MCYFCKVIFVMETVKRIGILGLLMVFLFGITGLSIFHHTCSSSNQDKISVYAEIYKGAPVSCCEDETFGSSPVNPADLPQNFQSAPCCKSTNYFLALQIISERLYRIEVKDVTPISSPLPLPLPEFSTDNQLLVHSVYFQFYSPPLFGKQLIHYLHQIKIPSHPDLA